MVDGDVWIPFWQGESRGFEGGAEFGKGRGVVPETLDAVAEVCDLAAEDGVFDGWGVEGLEACDVDVLYSRYTPSLLFQLVSNAEKVVELSACYLPAEDIVERWY